MSKRNNKIRVHNVLIWAIMVALFAALVWVTRLGPILACNDGRAVQGVWRYECIHEGK